MRARFAWALVWTSVALAQRGGAPEWVTGGNDAQRSHWVRSDPKISSESLRTTGFEFLWKIRFHNEPRQSNSLSPVILLDKYTGYRGHKSLGFLGGSADNIFAIDTDLGLVHWQNHLSTGVKQPAGTPACPGGMTSGVTRPASAAIQNAPAGFRGGPGRSSPAQTGAGKPDQGAVTLAQIPPPRTGSGGPPPARPLALLYALSSDGMLQTMYVSNGADAEPPTAFLPPNANASGLMVVDGVAYAATTNGCGGAPNGVWGLDLATKQVTRWSSGSAGTAGFAFGPDGTLYAATGAGLAALEPRTLKVQNTSGRQEFITSPVVFEYKGKILVAAATRDGAIHLLDRRAASLDQTPAHAAGDLTSWQDPGGGRWILAPEAKSIGVWRVADRNGAPALERAWTSRGITAPLTPIVVNGVMFAVSSGPAPAVLYALEAATGKELWNSGGAISSSVRAGGLSGGGTQIYLGTHDGTLYAFGFPIEH